MVADIATDDERPALYIGSRTILTLTATSLSSSADEQWRISLQNEAFQIETAGISWAEVYRHRAAFFHSIATYLALASALVATIAGGTGLALTGKTRIGAVIALIAGALAAISGTLSAGTRTGQEQASAIANTNLADAARVFRTMVARFGSHEEVLCAFKSLCEQREYVVKTAPIESARTLSKVRKELRRLEQMQKSPLEYNPHNGLFRPGTASAAPAQQVQQWKIVATERRTPEPSRWGVARRKNPGI